MTDDRQKEIQDARECVKDVLTVYSYGQYRDKPLSFVINTLLLAALEAAAQHKVDLRDVVEHINELTEDLVDIHETKAVTH